MTAWKTERGWIVYRVVSQQRRQVKELIMKSKVQRRQLLTFVIHGKIVIDAFYVVYLIDLSGYRERLIAILVMETKVWNETDNIHLKIPNQKKSMKP